MTGAALAKAQGARTIRGVVQDPDTRPLAGVTLQLAGIRPVVTDDSGRFRLDVPHRNRVTFELRRVGLIPSRFGLGEGGDTALAIVMLPSPQTLERVDVTARETDAGMELTGFNQRMRERERGTNSGYFVTASEIDKRNPARLSQLFDQFPSIRCRPPAATECHPIGSQQMTDRMGRGFTPCPITVYLDGQRLNVGGRYATVEVDNLLTPGSIGGMEYYPSGNRIPPKYQLLNGSCGLLLLWTRRGGGETTVMNSSEEFSRRP